MKAQAAPRGWEAPLAPTWSLEELDAPQSVLPVITGCGRSGSTLLKVIVDSHPDIAVLPGGEQFAPRARRLRRLETGGGLDVDRFMERFQREPLSDIWGLDVEDIRSALSVQRPRTAIQAVRRLGAIYARLRGKPRYGLKANEYATEIVRVAANLPEARFVHIIRDGRDVAAALCDAAFATDNAIDAAVQWKRRVLAAREAGRGLGPKRYLEVRYEELVAAPERTLRPLCEFLELDFDGSMLRHHERDVDSLPARARLPHHTRLQLPVTPGLRDWRRDQEPGTVALVELAAGDALAELGYPLAGLSPATAAGVRARGRIAVATMRDRWRPGRVKRILGPFRAS